jgi:hypothetical protein
MAENRQRLTLFYSNFKAKLIKKLILLRLLQALFTEIILSLAVLYKLIFSKSIFN